MRWWDGVAWGPVAPAGGQTSNDRTLSILTHGGVLVGGFVLPLVFYLISDDETRPETRWHSREALNFQLTFLAAYLGAFIVFFVGLGASGVFGASGSEAGAGVGFGLSFIVFFAVVFGAVDPEHRVQHHRGDACERRHPLEVPAPNPVRPCLIIGAGRLAARGAVFPTLVTMPRPCSPEGCSRPRSK